MQCHNISEGLLLLRLGFVLESEKEAWYYTIKRGLVLYNKKLFKQNKTKKNHWPQGPFLLESIIKEENFAVHYESMPIQIYCKFYHQNMKISVEKF